MWLFWVLISIAIFGGVSASYNEDSKKKYITFVFLILGFLMMFRSERVGNDTDVYTYIFKYIAGFRSHAELWNYIALSRFETGYVLLNWILSRISADPQILFIISGAFTSIAFGRFIYRYSEIPWLSILMFLTLQFFDLSLTAVRQIIAIDILLFSYDYIVERKPVQFLLLVFAATLFHTSSFLFVVVYIACRKERSGYFYLFSGLLGFIMFVLFSSVIPIIDRFLPSYTKYFTNAQADSYKTTATLAIVLMLILWIIMFFIAKYIREDDDIICPEEYAEKDYDEPDDSMMINYRKDIIMEISVWISIITLLLALRGTILGRFKYVFSSAILIYYPNSISKCPNISNKKIITVISAIVFILYIVIIYTYRPEWQSTYPYSFFWE